jgi:hypothetical protein
LIATVVANPTTPVCGSTACVNEDFKLCTNDDCGTGFCHAYTATLDGNPYPAYCENAAQQATKKCGPMEPGEYGVNIEDEYYGCPYDGGNCAGDCDFGDPRGQENYYYPGQQTDECNDVVCSE